MFFVDRSTGLPNTVEEVSQAQDPGLSAANSQVTTHDSLGPGCQWRNNTLGVTGGFQTLNKVHDVLQVQVATSTQVHVHVKFIEKPPAFLAVLPHKR